MLETDKLGMNGMLFLREKKLEKVLPPKLLSFLQLGASPDEMDSFEREQGLRLPIDIRELYSWKNGSVGGKVGFIPEFSFLSLPSIATELASYKGALPSHALPIMGNGAGEYIYVDTRKRKGSMLYLWTRENPALKIAAFDSVTAFLDTITIAWEKGVFGIWEVENMSTKDGLPLVPYVDFTSLHSRRKWNDLVREYNPNTFRRRRGIAILNTAFLLHPPKYVESAIFTEREYLGFAEAFPNEALRKHWNELVATGRVTSCASRTERQEELEWLQHTITILKELLRAKRRDKSAGWVTARIAAQIQFLETLRLEVLRSSATTRRTR